MEQSGLVGDLETLCGQAYGAQQYHKLITHTYTVIISLFLVCLPICMLWFFVDKLLILIGQDHEISIEARKYAIWVIPALFGGAISKPLFRYLQTQLDSSYASIFFGCFMLTFADKLGFHI